MRSSEKPINQSQHGNRADSVVNNFRPPHYPNLRKPYQQSTVTKINPPTAHMARLVACAASAAYCCASVMIGSLVS